MSDFQSYFSSNCTIITTLKFTIIHKIKTHILYILYRGNIKIRHVQILLDIHISSKYAEKSAKRSKNFIGP